MSLETRLTQLERRFGSPDTEPSLTELVAEGAALDAWLAAQGHSDPHEALAAGLETPPRFRHVSVAAAATVQEQIAVDRWFDAWGGIVFYQRRLADPRWAAFDSARQYHCQELIRCQNEAAGHKARLAVFGISVALALHIARGTREQPRPDGSRMPAEDLASIVAAIEQAEGKEAAALQVADLTRIKKMLSLLPPGR